jgi:hypothetical protein
MKTIQQKNKKRFFIRQDTFSVSEVIGIVLILAIVIGAMTGVYLMVFNPLSSGNNRAPAVELVVSVNEAGNKIFFEHRGGPPLTTNIDITVSIGGDRQFYLKPGDASLPFDGDMWFFGQRLVYSVDASVGTVRGLLVSVLIVDKDTNSILLDTIIQEGDLIMLPFASFISADPLYNSVDLKLQYNTRDFTGEVKFYFLIREKPQGTTIPDYYEPLTINQRLEKNGANENGFETFTIESLQPLSDYQCVAVANFTIGGNDIIRLSQPDEFSTGGFVLGNWSFPAQGSFGSDSSGYNNMGTFTNFLSQFTRKTPGVPPPIGYGDSAMFYGMDEYMQVNNHYSLNDPTETFTLEAWIQKKVDEDYKTYDEPTISDRMDFDANSFPMSTIPRLFTDDPTNDIDFIHVYESYYALVFRDKDNKGWVVTVEIDGEGVITYKDHHRFRNAVTINPRMIHAYDEDEYKVFAVVYTTSTTTQGQGGSITTLAIFNTGTINTDFVKKHGTLEGTSTIFRDPHIIKIKQGADSSLFAVAYGTNQNSYSYKQKIQTLNISHSDSAITLKYSSLFCYMNPGDHGAISGSSPFLFWVHNDSYAVVYSDAETANRPIGRINTFQINDVEGSITPKQTQSPYSISLGVSLFDPQVLRLKVDHEEDKVLFCFLYQFFTVPDTGPSLMHLYIHFFNISFEGTFETPLLMHNTKRKLIDTYESTTYRYFPKVAEIHSDDDYVHLALVYSGFQTPTHATRRGLMTTLNISLETYDTVITKAKTFFSHESSNPTLLKISTSGDSTLFAVAHRAGWDRRGEIKTIQVGNNGELPNTYGNYIMIHSHKLYLGPPVGIYPDMIHVNENYYATVYRDNDVEGIIRVIEINQDGQFINSDVDTLIFTRRADFPRLVKISEDTTYSYVAVIYRGNQSFMAITTIKIDKSNGEITHIDDFISSSEIRTGFQDRDGDSAITHRSEIDIVHVRDVDTSHQTFAVVCIHEDYFAYLHVVNITNQGVHVYYLTSNKIDSSVSTPHMTPSITHIRDDFFAIAYTIRTNSWRHSLFVTSYEIVESGLATKKSTRTIYTPSNFYHGAYFPNVISVEGNYIAISATVNEYYLKPTYGMIWTYFVNDNGIIGQSAVDTQKFNEHPTSQIFSQVYSHLNIYIRAQKLLHLQNDVYLITHRGGIAAIQTHQGHLQLIRINGTNGRIKDTRITHKQFESQYIRYVYSDPIIIRQNNENIILGLAYSSTLLDNAYSGVFVTVKNITISLKDFPLQPLVAKGQLNNNDGYGLFINETRIVGKINNQQLIIKTEDLIENQWNYIVLTKTESTIELYLNGHEKDSKDYSTDLDKNNAHLLFAQYFPVQLDEIRIKAIFMDDTEITAQYQQYISQL